MKNKEKYAKEIAEFAINEKIIGLMNGKLVACNDLTCLKCGFYCENGNCIAKKREWAEAEYEEPKIDLPSDIKVDAPILVSNSGEIWHRRHFAKREKNLVLTWADGKTSWSAPKYDTCAWDYAKLPTEEHEV